MGKDGIVNHVRKAQEALEIGQQLQETQIATVARSVADLFENFKEEMRQQMLAEMAKLTRKSVTPAKEDN